MFETFRAFAFPVCTVECIVKIVSAVFSGLRLNKHWLNFNNLFWPFTAFTSITSIFWIRTARNGIFSYCRYLSVPICRTDSIFRAKNPIVFSCTANLLFNFNIYNILKLIFLEKPNCFFLKDRKQFKPKIDIKAIYHKTIDFIIRSSLNFIYIHSS